MLPLTQPCSHCGATNVLTAPQCVACGSNFTSVTPGFIERLRLYLPAHLLETLSLTSISPTTLATTFSHLEQIRQRIAQHLPGWLVEKVCQAPQPGATGGEFLEGTLLFADISGFTAMSESLSHIGKEGAEEVTTIANGYFTTMLSLLQTHGGQLIRLGGDALLGLFLEPQSASRAAQAALAMQAAMVNFAQTPTSQGTFPLHMKVALRRGRFFAARLGTAQAMQFALFGADVNATAQTESAARPGQVLTDQNTLAAIGAGCQAQTLAENPTYAVLETLVGAPPPPPPPLTFAALPHTGLALQHLVSQLDALALYLSSGLLARLVATDATQELEGEHRLVAVLFAHIHGLGAMVERLGPGQEAAIVAQLNNYYQAMDTVIRLLGGNLNKLDLYDYGDKLLAFFGAPIAHEDDAERAVRAALAMQAALTALQSAENPLQQQIGVNIGYVFAGYVGAQWQREYTVMGDEVNLAARLMAVAPTGSVTVSPNVRRKTQATFEFAAQGAVKLKGKSAPVPIFTTLGLRITPEPSQGEVGLRSILVGRATEWERLQAACAHLQTGTGHIITISGEAGLGKSRLAAELRQHLSQIAWVEGRCLSYTTTVSYSPMLELLRQLAGLQPEDAPTESWGRLHETLANHFTAEEAREEAPYLANFLGLPLDEHLAEKLHLLEAEALRQRTFIAIRLLIESYLRKGTPLILVIDDLHWVDQASVELLEYLLPLVERGPLLWVVLYRPERESLAWRVHAKIAREYPNQATDLNLTPLNPEAGHQLLTNLIPLSVWPTEVANLIFNRTEGNPLHIEEILRSLVESGHLVRDEQGQWQMQGDINSLQVPDTLEGVMMARLDQLAELSRHSAQAAAVVGRIFPLELLAQATPEQTPLQRNQRLTELQEHEIVRSTQRRAEMIYAFKHAVMHEVCYGSLLARTRRQLHRKIATYLATQQGEVESNYPLIAHHAFEGQDWEQALHYQLLAGQRAQTLFANREAIEHFTKALLCADNLAPTTTAPHRLKLHMALGELLTTTGQYERALTHLQHALLLAAEQHDVENQVRACRWQTRLHELRGEYVLALEWAEKGLTILAGRMTVEAAQLLLFAGLVHRRKGGLEQAAQYAEQSLQIGTQLNDLALVARAYNLLGLIRLRKAPALAIEHFKQALALYQQTGDIHGQATSANLIGTASFDIGQWLSADLSYRQARQTFEQLGDIYHCAMVDNNLGEIARKQGRIAEAINFYQTALTALKRIGGSVYILGALHNNLGAAFIQQKDFTAARQQLYISLEYFKQSQARDFLPELHRHLAEAALLATAIPEAWQQAQLALQLAEEQATRTEAGSCQRVLGEIAAHEGNFSQAEQYLQQSITTLDAAGEAYEGALSRLTLARLYAQYQQPAQSRLLLTQCLPVLTRLEAAQDLAEAQALAQQVEAATP